MYVMYVTYVMYVMYVCNAMQCNAMRCNAMQCTVCVCRHVRMYVIYAVDIPLKNAKLTLAEHSAPSDSHTRFFSEICRKKHPFFKKYRGVVFISRCPENAPKNAWHSPEVPPEVGQCCNHCGCPFWRVGLGGSNESTVGMMTFPMGKHVPKHQPDM
jgi:hypothetical protein